MITIEHELTAGIYVLYAMDCVHWLKPGQTALTRQLTGGWRSLEYKEESFTLLGRMPVLANPIDLRPGWALYDSQAPSFTTESIEQFLEESMPDRRYLTAISILAGLNLLVVFPWLLMSGLLGMYFRAPVALLMTTHLLIAFEVYAQAGLWRTHNKGEFLREFVSLLLNPLAALRSGDVLCQALFDLKFCDESRQASSQV